MPEPLCLTTEFGSPWMAVVTVGFILFSVGMMLGILLHRKP